jgi:hypothetical protein
MKRVLRRLWGTIVVLAVICGAAWAQETAQISGVVKDESGGVLPGATVTVTQTETGFSRNSVTDTEGTYRLTNLPLGPYKLEVTLEGFRTYTQTGIVLQVGSAPALNVTLGVGQLTEAVTVEAAAPLVDTQRAGIGEVIENERIIELPLNGRNPTDLIELAGAAVNLPDQGASTRSFQGSAGGQGIAVAGGQTGGTAYMLDGAMHNNPYDNLNLPLPFPDALQEFRVETGALGATAGVHSGAAVNAVTKSGTNQYHGAFFEFWRNRRFNATNPFALRGPDGKRRDDGLNRNQFGGTLGGPVMRDRLFFFGGYQGTIIRQIPTDNVAFVPNAQMLAGDFTAYSRGQCGVPLNLRGPAVGNRIDPALFSPAALRIARELPTTTDPCGRVVYGQAANRDEGQAVARLDYQAGQSQQFFGRYIHTGFDQPPPFASSDNILTSATGGFDNKAHSLTVGQTWVLNTNMVNSLRFAWNHTDVHRYHHGYFNAPQRGINIYSYLDDYFILSVTGGFNIGSGVNNEARFKTTTFQAGDDLNIIKGDHQLSAGVNVARWDSLSLAHVRSPGSFSVNGQVTGLGLADFLLGNVSEFLQAAPNTLDMYQWYVGVYGADTWRVGPKLTLNYGVRWEPFLPQQIPNGYIYNFSVERFLAGQKSRIYPNAPAGFVYPGDEEFVGGFSGMNKRWTQFAPRAAFAWDPKGDGMMSLRGGYSLAYDFVNAQYHLNTSVAPPWGAEVRLPSVSLDNPYASFPGGNPFPRVFDANAPFPQQGSYLIVDPDTKNTRQHSWNLAFQRQLGPATLVSATYLGNRTNNLWNMKALNPGVNIPGATQANLPQRRLLTMQNPAEGRFLAAVDLHDASGRQNYHGMLLSFQRRESDLLNFSGNYTLSKCEGHPVPNAGLPNVGTGWSDPNSPDYDYGPCISDRRHVMNATVGVETPELGGVLGTLGSGWRVNAILRAQSGAPLTVATGQDRALTGIVTNQRADQISNDVYGDRDNFVWLNRAAFAQPAFGTLGNSKRGGYRAPRRWIIDMVVARNLRFGGQRIELRAEAFNVTNNIITEPPVTNLSNVNFGRILEFARGFTPRVLQFGVKYEF